MNKQKMKIPKRNHYELLVESGKDLSKLVFDTQNLYQSNASLRKNMNTFDQATERLNKFWKNRSGTSISELGKRDQENINKILGSLSRSEKQIGLYIIQREKLVDEFNQLFEEK